MRGNAVFDQDSPRGVERGRIHWHWRQLKSDLRGRASLAEGKGPKKKDEVEVRPGRSVRRKAIRKAGHKLPDPAR